MGPESTEILQPVRQTGTHQLLRIYTHGLGVLQDCPGWRQDLP